MSCNKCNTSPCCCTKRISLFGKKGDKGGPGKSSYIYIAYADDVVAGTPDVVTGYSTTIPKCWVAIRTSPIPLAPVEADFQDLWFNRCAMPNLDADEISASMDQAIVAPTAANITTVAFPNIGVGTYLIYADFDYSGTEDMLGTYGIAVNDAIVGTNRVYGTAGDPLNVDVRRKGFVQEKITIAAATDDVTIRVVPTTGTMNVFRAGMTYIKISS